MYKYEGTQLVTKMHKTQDIWTREDQAPKSMEVRRG